MRGSCIAAWLVPAALMLAACTGDEGDAAGTEGCDADAPVVAFDHETTDLDRGVGGGVPEVSVLSADGSLEMVTGSWVASQAAFSPDGRQLVVVRADGDYESAGPDATTLWILGTDGADPRALTGGDVLDAGPAWSPDGSSIAFARTSYDGDYNWSIVTAPAEGGEPAELFSAGVDTVYEPVWSPDGRRIAFVRSVYVADRDVETTVWTMEADGRDARPLVTLPHVSSVDWHPDGTTLLIDSDNTEGESYLVDGDTGRVEGVTAGPDLATWSPAGDSAYYFRGTGEPPDTDWSIVEGHVEDGALVDDRTVLAGDDLDGTVLADVGLYPGFSLAVGPCA